MKVSGFSPVAFVLVIIGITAAIFGLLLANNSPLVDASHNFESSGDTAYCNSLAANFPSPLAATDAFLAGTTPLEGTAESAGASTLTDDTSEVPPFGAITPFGANDDLILPAPGRTILITSGTGAGQERLITANTGTEVTVDSAWDTTPDATSFYKIRCSDVLTASANPNVTVDVRVPVGIPNFAVPYQVFLTPNSVTINETGDGGADGLGTEIPIGAKIGGLRAFATLGTTDPFTDSCGTATPVNYILWNVALPNGGGNPRAVGDGTGTSTNIVFPRRETESARFDEWNVGSQHAVGAGTLVTDGTVADVADATNIQFTNFPSYLLNLFDPDWIPDLLASTPAIGAQSDGTDGPLDPVIPIAVYAGATNVVSEWRPLYFLQFGAGDLGTAFAGQPRHPFARLTADQGQPSFAVLVDPSSSVGSLNTVGDFCAPLEYQVMLKGLAPGGQVRIKTPAAVGTGFTSFWTMGFRDLDQDGRESGYDPCPSVAGVDRTGTATDDPAAMPNPLLHNAAQLVDVTASPPFITGQFLGRTIEITGGTGSGQSSKIIIASTNTVTVSPHFTTVPDNTSTYSIKNAGEDKDADALPLECEADDTVTNTDQDGDTFINNQDNCPNDSNVLQEQSELTVATWGVAAADGGLITDQIGDACDNEIGTIVITQNGVTETITTSDTVANGHFGIAAITIPKCFGGGTDADHDGYCAGAGDSLDNDAVQHTAWSGGQLGLDTDKGGANTVGSSDPDTKLDSDWLEHYLGTDPSRPCAATTTAFDEPVDNYSFDFNDDRILSLGDVLLYIGLINLTVDNPTVVGDLQTPGTRADLNSDGKLSLGDALLYIGVINKPCTATAPNAIPQQ